MAIIHILVLLKKNGYSGTAIYTKLKPLSVKHGIGIQKLWYRRKNTHTGIQKFHYIKPYTFQMARWTITRLQYKLGFLMMPSWIIATSL